MQACTVDQKNVSSLALNKTFPILTNYTTCTSKSHSEGWHLNTGKKNTIPHFFKSKYEKGLHWFTLAYKVHYLQMFTVWNTKQLLFSICT